jgi:pSer/pThr/pTyr-binding forkhead associated (FHA) protein
MTYVIQRVTPRGLVVNQINVTSLRIGRGTSAELRSENPAVSLEHAVIDEDAAGFAVTDKGSITGTYVNGKPVETARLTKGDVIEIGDLKIEVQIADPGRPLFVRIAPAATMPVIAGELDEEEEEPVTGPIPQQGGTLRAPVVDYAGSYRLRRVWLTKLSLVALISIVTLTITSELLEPERQKAFMPGGVSSAHSHARDGAGKPIADNCHACHTPWQGVTGDQCRACHKMSPHAEAVRDEPACISCHPEHRAPKLAPTSQAVCASCHADLSPHVKPGVALLSTHARIRNFGDDHPEFSPAADNDTLRFNHKLHLNPGGIFNATGKREVLACATCHKLVADPRSGKADPRPIKFASDCQRCHKLTFDLRYPDLEVPHGGDPGTVYGFVFGARSGVSNLADKSPDEIRRILTSRAQVTNDESANIDAEHVIKTKCQKCHDLKRSGTRLAVVPPILPSRWLLHGKFSHGPAHKNLECTSCHETARRSALTTDVLIPKRSTCTGCHAGDEGRIPSSCSTCHDYHERSRNILTRATVIPASPLPTGGATGMVGTVLVCAIVLLLIVLLVPIGIVTYQRLKPRNEERPPQRPAAAPVPPPPPPPLSPAAVRVDVPTSRIPAVADAPSAPPAPRPAAPAPAAPAPPPAPPASAPHTDVDSTRVVKLSELGAPEPGGTEIVEWYGLILWKSGPLEGQRKIVEPKGFYIGRDPALADVVIPDARVSKRHLRVVPRDGRAHVIDDGSTNGTFLAANPGVRISDHELKRGDTVILGDGAASFVFQI